MKLTGELKKAIESANTEEEKKAVVEEFKDEIKQLSDEEIEGVAGGWWWNPFKKLRREFSVIQLPR